MQYQDVREIVLGYAVYTCIPLFTSYDSLKRQKQACRLASGHMGTPTSSIIFNQDRGQSCPCGAPGMGHWDAY